MSNSIVSKVSILMCTYNGVQFIAEQLRSIERQTHHRWTLHVSDDGSTDGTLELLQAFNANCEVGRSYLVVGPGRGFVANFLSLTCRSDIEADFYAWSDQDDIWKEDKLQRALDWLETVPGHIPALYCGRTELVCESGQQCGYSPKFRLPPSFSNALVQSIAGGNTMVFNHAARALLQEAGSYLVVPSHDWWAYQLVSGCGGVVNYDPEPMLLYRQHDNNLIGSNAGWLARFKRMRLGFEGRFCEWNGQNIAALETMRHRLASNHQAALDGFKVARNKNLIQRILGFLKVGIYRQTVLGNLALIFAVVLKKV